MRTASEHLDLICLVCSAYFALLATLIAHLLLMMRFDVLTHSGYQQRNLRGLWRAFKVRPVQKHAAPHRLANPSKELREIWERCGRPR